MLGEDHPDTLFTRNNLAHWKATSGDAAGAVQAYTDLLADRTRVLGEDHPSILLTRNNLAHWKTKQLSPTPRTFIPSSRLGTGKKALAITLMLFIGIGVICLVSK
ncbi:tetratricopeptide repeat protein [Streptomyces sp. NPDC089919]|uniref:tetratricopeptide repeat protein n=1 Tax=Streptomyces sp. NPDC089919 TaxID=3155188 RepID=UPI0034249195